MKIADRVGSLCAVLALASCAPAEPQTPKAGDIVRLVTGSGSYVGTPGKTSLVSVYESASPTYAASRSNGRLKWGDDQMISGKRIRFLVDHSLVSWSARKTGPHTSVAVTYNYTNGGPVGRGNDDPVIAHLGQQQVGGNLTSDNIIRSDAPFGLIGSVPAGGLVRRDTSVCGLDAYDVTIPGDREKPHATGFGGPQAQRFSERFGGSMVFGVRDSLGRYDAVVSCSRYFPTCHAVTSYRGWPVQIVFGSDNVCEYRNIHAHVQKLFERFYVDESERSPGQENRLWFPAEIRVHPTPDANG